MSIKFMNSCVRLCVHAGGHMGMGSYQTGHGGGYGHGHGHGGGKHKGGMFGGGKHGRKWK